MVYGQVRLLHHEPLAGSVATDDRRPQRVFQGPAISGISNGRAGCCLSAMRPTSRTTRSRKPRNRCLLTVSDGFRRPAFVSLVGTIEASSDIRADLVADQCSGTGGENPTRTLSDVLARRQRTTHRAGQRSGQLPRSWTSFRRMATRPGGRPIVRPPQDVRWPASASPKPSF